ncbi:MAG: cytochrome c biogenesis protein CcdA [Crocinitomicaceae bacterium]|jgi:cytochrome c biogenesis protein CcdA
MDFVIAGLLTTITPWISLLSLLFFFVFGKFSASRRSAIQALILFNFSFLSLFFTFSPIMASPSFKGHFYLSLWSFVLGVCLCLWFLNLQSVISNQKLRALIDRVFSVLGPIITGGLFYLFVLAASGPILGTRMYYSMAHGLDVSISTVLIQYIIGVLLPILIVLIISQVAHKKSKGKPWWKAVQTISVVLLLILCLNRAIVFLLAL